MSCCLISSPAGLLQRYDNDNAPSFVARAREPASVAAEQDWVQSGALPSVDASPQRAASGAILRQHAAASNLRTQELPDPCMQREEAAGPETQQRQEEPPSTVLEQHQQCRTLAPAMRYGRGDLSEIKVQSAQAHSASQGDEFYRYKMPSLQSKVLTACIHKSVIWRPVSRSFPPPQIEGRGNGIKTNVMNMVDVAKALGRPASCACPDCLPSSFWLVDPIGSDFPAPPADTTKFFGCELGAQTKFEEASGLAIVNGAHDTQRLSQHLEVFIKKFVQCGQCGNPETDIIITKKEDIELKCKACGAVSGGAAATTAADTPTSPCASSAVRGPAIALQTHLVDNFPTHAQLTKVDMRHKLCTFIIKNPPAVKDKSSKCARQRVLPSASI